MDARDAPSPPLMEESSDMPLADPVAHDTSLVKEGMAPDIGSRNWKSVLFPAGKPSKIFKLRFIPPSPRDDTNVGVCSKDSVKGELVLLDLTLVGFFLGKRPAFSFVRAALLRQWKLRGNVEIIQLLHGGFAFRFSDVRDRDDILDGEAFYIGGQPMFIRKWERSLHTGGILGLQSVPLWVTLPGLPLHLWGEEALSAICSVLGKPLYADRTTAMKSRLAFARVCVEFSGANPLLEMVTIEDDMGLLYNQRVVYEWKPPQCLKCGVFGHEGCGILEANLENKHHEPAQRTVQEGLPSIPEMAAEKNKAGCMEGGCIPAPEKYRTRAVHHDDEGWEAVRAKKKRARRFGAPYPPRTRPGQEGAVASGDFIVSPPYWANLNLASEKVPISALELNMETNLNSKSCRESAPCPLTLSSDLDGLEESLGQEKGPLTSENTCGVAPPHWAKKDALVDQFQHQEMDPLLAETLNFKNCPNRETNNSPASFQTCADPNGENLSSIEKGLEKSPWPGTPNGPLLTEKHPKVSASHWSNLAHLNAKMSKAVDTPNEEKISNFEGDPKKVLTSPYSSSLGLQSEPLKSIDSTTTISPSSAGKNGVTNFQSKTAFHSRSSKQLVSGGARPSFLGSTAGHTPFKSRLASLAKELRIRKHGQSSMLENSAIIPSTEDELYSSVSHQAHGGPIGTYRPKPLLMQQHRNHSFSDLHANPLSNAMGGEEDDLLEDGLDPIKKGEPQLHMEMPNYLMTRKKLMEEQHVEYVSAKEKPMMELENQEREMSSVSATQGEEIKSYNAKRNLEGKEDLGHAGLGVDAAI